MSARAVALVGLRCSGKTRVGRRLAELLARPFLDLDEELARLHAEEQGGAAPDEAGVLLQRLGLAGFRALEERALARALAADAPLVLATGGGVVESTANRALLRARCTCVWLRAAPEVLRWRMERDPAPRPALTPAGALAEIELLARRRAPLYEVVADHAVDASAQEIEPLARSLLELLGGDAR